MAEDGAAYDRGHLAGEIAQRLKNHDDHLGAINGSIGDTAKALDRLTMSVQRLADAADADRAKALALATGLKEADEARQQKSGERWSPLTRLCIAAGGIASTLAALALILSHFH
jgi:hypothetical protein